MATPVKKWLLRVAPWFLPVGIVAVWQLASSVGWLSTRILPSPEGVVTAFWTLSASGELWQHLAISSWRALIGFSIGGSLGLILGLISGYLAGENGCWIPQFRCCATCRIWR
ncbi:putative aliphatic sulfonates ABC transporter permease [Escherichia coli]|uniref:Putative aliphatic sulfonates ABC transporter permease n=1 Tax=Escherichia coli TaxID=562 RepID=A0A377AUV1_ECOLX|nr:putative aliphatic sulfonates ABC transporter permease [Escherichia coli]